MRWWLGWKVCPYCLHRTLWRRRGVTYCTRVMCDAHVGMF